MASRTNLDMKNKSVAQLHDQRNKETSSGRSEEDGFYSSCGQAFIRINKR